MHHTQSTSPTTQETLPVSPQNPNAHPSHIRKYSDIFGIFAISRSSSDSEIFGNIRKYSFQNERETLWSPYPSVREWYHTWSPEENILGLKKGHDTLYTAFGERISQNTHR